MEKRPSERIKELASDFWDKRFDRAHSAGPIISDWMSAVVTYLDEEYDRKQKEGEDEKIAK